jgi:hypothetical protein
MARFAWRQSKCVRRGHEAVAANLRFNIQAWLNRAVDKPARSPASRFGALSAMI